MLRPQAALKLVEMTVLAFAGTEGAREEDDGCVMVKAVDLGRELVIRDGI